MGRGSCLFLAEQSVCNTFGGLLLILLYDVGVEGLCGADVQVAELL